MVFLGNAFFGSDAERSCKEAGELDNGEVLRQTPKYLK